jgi:subtilase family serine protease
MTRISVTTLSSALATAAIFALTLTAASAQPRALQTTSLQPRITAPINNADRVTLAGSRSPQASPSADVGTVPTSMKLSGISLVFSRTPAQQADLDALITAQQTPSSPLYHQWLTPDQFAARFGVADADIAAVQNWLQLQGFAIDSVSRSRDRIFFSGTAALVSSAFGAPLHYFKSTAPNGAAVTHFAPANDLTLPTAFASSVQAITNLSDFRPHPHIKRSPASVQAAVSGVQPNFTSSLSGSHFITPGDIATIYDVTPAYNAGFTGANQSIVIIGQSAVSLTDIATFQAAVGITARTPQLVLVPGSGASTTYTGDEGESDLDLEYTSTIAKGAQVFFVYTGNNTNYGVFDSLQYAVDERIAPIISSSYGDCETDLGQTNYNLLNGILQQAATQGQTVISAAGDSGSPDCYGDTNLTLAQQEAPAADFPASSQYVTGMGGTEFPTADVAVGNNTYFTAQGSTDTVSSALSYIPEGVWNDDLAALAAGVSPFSAGGGGVSVFSPRPTWQTGSVGGTAIPSGTFRLVPDISLDASPNNAPLAYCTSDTTYWSNGQVSSCTSGLRDSTTGDLTIAGGTSFDAPTFAGMLALIEQAVNSTGEGLINPTLYTLASNSTTYASAFHDITSGGNQCLGGTNYCSTAGAADYAATTGYDEASGLGSIDLFHLLTAWPTTSASSLAATVITLVPATLAPAVGASDFITITVAPVSTNAAVPTGIVALVIDGVAATSSTTVTLANGAASYTFPAASSTTGEHIINATYSGDATFAPSTATLTLDVLPPGTFTLSATNATVKSGSSATSTVTATPSQGYTGTVDLSLAIPTNSTLTDVCATDTNNGIITITGTAAATDVVTVYTSLTTCNNLGLTTAVKVGKGGTRILPITHRGAKLSSSAPQRSPWNQLPLPTALAGMVLLFGLRRRANRNLLRIGLSFFVVAMISIAGLGLTACSNNSTAAVTTLGNTPPGTYTIQIIGTDSATSALTSTANVTLTVN